MRQIVLFDGVCVLCSRSVQFIIARDMKKSMMFSSLQSEFAKTVMSTHPDLNAIDSIILCQAAENGDERFLIKSDAVIEIVRNLGGVWKMVAIASFIPKPVCNFFYDCIAGNRYSWFGKYDSCPVPDPLIQSRFIF